MRIDLHNHSYYSDGVLSPSALVHLAKEQNCEVFALTDHDTTDGLNEAKNAADKLAIRLIDGVEISATFADMSVHIVGLNIDINNKILQQGLQQHQDLRKRRANKIADKLATLGIKNALKQAKLIAKTPLITRTHFAQMLIAEGHCKDIKAAFKTFLAGKNDNTVWSSAADVIDWIHQSGGVAVLAHPFRYRLNKRKKVKQLITAMKAADCDGIEVVTAHSSFDEIALANQWANELGLSASVGSDYHGWANQKVQIANLQKLPTSSLPIWSRF